MPRLERMAPPARPLPAEALALIGRGSGGGALPMPSSSEPSASGLPPLHSNLSTPTSSRGGAQPFRAHALESPGSRSELSVDAPILQLLGSSPGGSSSEQLTLARVPTEELGEGLATQRSMASVSSLGTADLQMTIELDVAPAASSWSAQPAPAGDGAPEGNAAGHPSSTAQRDASPDRGPEGGMPSSAAADPLGVTSNVGVRSAAVSPARPPQLALSSSLGASPTLATPPVGASALTAASPDLDVPALAYARLAAEGSAAARDLHSGEAIAGAAAFAGSRQLTREVSELAYMDRDPLDGSPTHRFRPTTDAELGPEQAGVLYETQLESSGAEQLLGGPAEHVAQAQEPAAAQVFVGDEAGLGTEVPSSNDLSPVEDLFVGVEKELSVPLMETPIEAHTASGLPDEKRNLYRLRGLNAAAP